MTSEKRLRSIFENLENGNLTDAKARARGISAFCLSRFAQQVIGWSYERSVRAAQFLKGTGSFQHYCDAS